jgi:hypothetical protein
MTAIHGLQAMIVHSLTIPSSHKAKRHITADGQTASQSWCQAPFGVQDQIFVTARQLRFCRREAALSDERTGRSFTAAIISSTCHLYLQFYIAWLSLLGWTGYLASARTA